VPAEKGEINAVEGSTRPQGKRKPTANIGGLADLLDIFR
jgi:hypothetical protein